MASVHKRKNSRYWYAAFTQADGQRKFRTTKLLDKRAALRLAIRWEDAAREAKENNGLSEIEHEQILREITAIRDPLGASQTAYNPLNTFEAYLESYIQSKRSQVDPSTIKKMLLIKRRMVAMLKPGAHLKQFNPAVARAWRNKHLEEGYSATTINSYIGLIGKAFKEAVQMGYISSSPLDSLRLPNKNPQSRQAFTFEQFLTLLSVTNGEMRMLIILAGYTGQRMYDCLHIKWSDIDLDRDIIVFYRKKNKDNHTVPIHESLKTALENYLRNYPTNCLFEKLRNKPGSGGSSISHIFVKKILPRIGIFPPERICKGKGRQVSEYSFHSLRHSFSTWLHETGVSDTDRMRMVGHLDPNVGRGYTHSSLEHMKIQVNLLPKI